MSGDISRFVTGCTAAGKALGAAPITIRRMIRDGRLKPFRTGNNTSPYKFWLTDIERIRRASQMQPSQNGAKI